MNKKFLMGMLIACTATVGMNAQQPANSKELNKELLLEKDFVPVVKKVTKKKTLPKVKKVTPPAKTNLDYSTTPVTIEVPTTIPTMQPYGYRTAHNFSDKRGYLEVGGGMQANFDGSAGYRLLDSEKSQAGIWVQHNSTWAGKNHTPLITDDALRAKQVYNDNRGGLYFANQFGAGTLRLDAGVHFDSFNYYGAIKQEQTPPYDPEKKQTLLEFNVAGKWNGKLNLKDNDVTYRLNLGFNHAGYNMLPMAHFPNAKGAGENILTFGLGGDYSLEDYGTLALDVKGDYVNFKGAKDVTGVEIPVDNSYFNFTLSPRYKWENDIFRAQAGIDLIFGDLQVANSTSKFHIAPMVKIDVDVVDGVAIFADVKGGNCINSLSRMATLDRYSTPLGVGSNTWTQLDGEAGVKFGPFQGFSGKVFGGYVMSQGVLVHDTPSYYGGTPVELHASNAYAARKMRGFKAGVEFNYKYRSLIEAAASLTYAPGGDKGADEWLKGCSLGLDGARMVAGLNVKVTPIRQLAIDLGMDYRGERNVMTDTSNYYKIDDAFNLHAGASWRFDKVLTVWLKGTNLLNRKYDILPGQGAQGLNVMAGASLVF